MHTTVKAGVRLCKHGMRDDCPVEQCRVRFQHTDPSVIYSSAYKGPAPTPVVTVHTNSTPMNIPFPQPLQFGTRDRGPSEMCLPQHSNSNPLHPTLEEASAVMLASVPRGGELGEMELGQAMDGLSFYQNLINSHMTAQKAKIYAMSSQFHIPVPDLDSNSFHLPQLPFMVSPVANQVLTTTNPAITMPTNNGTFIPDEGVLRKPLSVPVLPSALSVPGLSQTQGALPTVQATVSGPPCSAATRPAHQSPFDRHSSPVAKGGTVPKQAHAASTAPKKDDMAYKTAPCRHFSQNKGWCPWGDECGFIHDPELEWVPTAEHNSGRSTPSSMTFIGSKSVQPDKALGSNSNKSAHCWGYIQGICPHLETCRYFHPDDIMPYIKYTPCLTWPRCGYPAQYCPLKHPQVDKLNPQQRDQTPAMSTTVVPQRMENMAPQTETYSGSQVAHQPHQIPAMPSPHPAAEGFVIPQAETYVSAKLHHRPTAPSPETFTPAPMRAAVRVRYPSEEVSRPQGEDLAVAPGPHDLGSYQGRARSVSIAVQKLNAELAGMAQLEVGGKGHGRGKSMNL